MHQTSLGLGTGSRRASEQPGTTLESLEIMVPAPPLAPAQALRHQNIAQASMACPHDSFPSCSGCNSGRAGATQTQANTDQHQPSTTTGPTEERQARRACQLVHQGDHTLQQLRDPVRRPIPTNTQHQPKQFSQLAFPTPTLTSRPTSYSPTCDGHGREQLQGHQASQPKPCDSCSTMSTPLRWHASRHH